MLVDVLVELDVDVLVEVVDVVVEVDVLVEEVDVLVVVAKVSYILFQVGVLPEVAV